MESLETTLYSIVDVLSNLRFLTCDPRKSMADNLDFASVGLDQKEMTKTDLSHPCYLHENLIKLIEDINCMGLEKQGIGGVLFSLS